MENNISMIPLYINFNEKSFKDRYDINVRELHSEIRKFNCIPKTSAPSPLDFYNSFKPYIENGSDIIYIGLSSFMSSTIQNALLAAGEFPKDKVHVIDSLNVSAGIGILAMRALDFTRMGLDANEITSNLKKLVSKIKIAFTVGNLEFLSLGGRCTKVQSTIGGILKIEPFLKVIDGEIVHVHSMRGRRKALAQILNEIINDIKIIDIDRIIIVHSMAIESVNFLEQELLKIVNPTELIILNAGCVISSHCGENSVGIVYITNDI